MAGKTKLFKAKLTAEIQKLRRQDGSYSPDDVVDFAKTHSKSELHKQFEWDDRTAAHEHRLFTARHLITLHIRVVSSSGGIVQLISVPSLRRSDEGSYLSPDVVSGNAAYRGEVLDEIKSKLRTMMETFEPLLPELDPVWKAVKKTC